MKRAIAMVVLGLCLSGIVYAADPVAPEDVLRDARGGEAEAQVEMGILYEYGFRMKGNRVVALAWYQLAADQGNVRAAKYRDRLQSKLSAPQVEKARKQSKTLVSSPKPSPGGGNLGP
jgi:TPR repeat protein